MCISSINYITVRAKANLFASTVKSSPINMRTQGQYHEPKFLSGHQIKHSLKYFKNNINFA